MAITRRGLIGLVGACTAAAGAGVVSVEEMFAKALPQRSIAPGNQKWVMVIDLSKCDGCRACTAACNKMHFVPPMQEWIRVYEVSNSPGGAGYYMPRPCMHCDNPPCVRGCPVGATYKRTDGIVIQDNDRCIGCRSCIAQCPYSARAFNWSEPPHTEAELQATYSPDLTYPHRKGTVEKCGFCAHMLVQGKLPVCATACTMGAIYFGDELEDAVTNARGETIQLSKAVRKGAAFRLMEELGTEPRVYYLPPVNRKYPGPDEKPDPKA